VTIPFTVEAMPPALDAGGFCCEVQGNDEIGNYLANGDADRDQHAGLSRIFIVRDLGGDVIAYYSLQADAVELAPREVIPGVHYRSVPAIKVARIGVRFDQRGKGVGLNLMAYIESEVLSLAKLIGVRFITLDAVGDKIDWYRRLGYQVMQRQAQASTEADQESGDRSMYYDLGPLSGRP
jgi:GNAT superfamily N-acetyltransferase